MTLSAPLSTEPIRGYADGIAAGVISLPQVEQIIFVDQGSNVFEDGTRQFPYHDIASAIAAATGEAPTTNNRILIYILPGVYAEGVTTADDFVYFAGVHQDSCEIRPPAGTDALTLDNENISFWNLAFRSNATTSRPFTSTSSVANVEFHECIFENLVDGANNFSEIDDNGAISFFDCQFIAAAARRVIQMSSGLTGVARFEGCQFTGAVESAGKTPYFFRCVMTSEFNMGVIDMNGTTGRDLWVYDCDIYSTAANCINMEVDTDLIAKNNRLDSANVSDIDATNQVTGCIIENNVMTSGMDPNVVTASSKKYVGSTGDKDFYASLEDAFSAITFDDCTIFLLNDISPDNVAPPNYTMIVDALGCTISRDGTLLNFTNSSTLTIKNAVLEGVLRIAFGTAILRVLDCFGVVSFNVHAGNASTLLNLDQCDFESRAASNYGIRINDADPVVVIRRSRLKSASGDPVFLWDNGVTNDNLKIAYSVIMHGDLGANNPFARDAAQTPDYAAHHCAYNVAEPAWLTNLIAAGQTQNCIDVNADY